MTTKLLYERLIDIGGGLLDYKTATSMAYSLEKTNEYLSNGAHTLWSDDELKPYLAKGIAALATTSTSSSPEPTLTREQRAQALMSPGLLGEAKLIAFTRALKKVDMEDAGGAPTHAERAEREYAAKTNPTALDVLAVANAHAADAAITKKPRSNEPPVPASALPPSTSASRFLDPGARLAAANRLTGEGRKSFREWSNANAKLAAMPVSIDRMKMAEYVASLARQCKIHGIEVAS